MKQKELNTRLKCDIKLFPELKVLHKLQRYNMVIKLIKSIKQLINNCPMATLLTLTTIVILKIKSALVNKIFGQRSRVDRV